MNNLLYTLADIIIYTIRIRFQLKILQLIIIINTQYGLSEMAKLKNSLAPQSIDAESSLLKRSSRKRWQFRNNPKRSVLRLCNCNS